MPRTKFKLEPTLSNAIRTGIFYGYIFFVISVFHIFGIGAPIVGILFALIALFWSLLLGTPLIYLRHIFRITDMKFLSLCVLSGFLFGGWWLIVFTGFSGIKLDWAFITTFSIYGSYGAVTAFGAWKSICRDMPIE